MLMKRHSSYKLSKEPLEQLIQELELRRFEHLEAVKQYNLASEKLNQALSAVKEQEDKILEQLLRGSKKSITIHGVKYSVSEIDGCYTLQKQILYK